VNRLGRRLHRRFLRDPIHGWLGGVCEGLANGLGVPASGVRIAVSIAALLFTTPVLIAYGAAWLLMDSREEALLADRELR
jgi:phage shock protein PspC (stress-responsive transcriptional regulator)